MKEKKNGGVYRLASISPPQRKKKKENNGNADVSHVGARRRRRDRLFADDTFAEEWGLLLLSPAWADKSPRALLWHLDRLAEYPTDFAVYLVARAIQLGLPFVVPDNCVEDLEAYMEEWKTRK